MKKHAYVVCEEQVCRVFYGHYENTPMQYTAIFLSRKNDNFHLIFFNYFHIFAKNYESRIGSNKNEIKKKFLVISRKFLVILVITRKFLVKTRNFLVITRNFFFYFIFV